ncbi:hypothetical protein PpBr36_08387 [Pyricularia pennisetigena]|uniref:hypothetical protein n=1 Tax=Pyricularia pennisetigena TaxID=1578925 RepID=UPI0011541581|nr:hypothetical protein PpBr36_08387 [Pyricularia pennisetigena]TLS24214.1 hypothetical protein PpBr36_08387 [Pyricularia pennisetigena]
MGSLEGLAPAPDFLVLDDARPEDKSLQAFMVSKSRGFLPRMDPVVTLPSEFDPLESILNRMPVKTLSGEPGLLADGRLGDVVKAELPDLTEAMDKYKDDLPLMNALYRDYSFLASAYLLEPCHQRFIKGEEYGLGRDVLPANIARPIARCAELTGFKPFMEYAGSYALYNYKLVEPARGLEYDNLRLIRAFEHGLDPSSSEAGFVLVHIDMVRNSGPLVTGVVEALDACKVAAPGTSKERREKVNSGLAKILEAMKKINEVMDTMWQKSKPRSYTSFRTFIFGITSQSMFPNGVEYEGVSNGERWDFRGESGANDSIIPTCDSVFGLPMPQTPLTDILKDFRQYRPSNHRQWIEWVNNSSASYGLKQFALGLDKAEDDTDEAALTQSKALWIQCLDRIREFRWRHWCFTREFILKQTSHPTATGGSPIVTWLPNQLTAVLDEMVNVYEISTKNGEKLGEVVEDIMDLATRQRETLAKEVAKYCQERGVDPAKQGLRV